MRPRGKIALALVCIVAPYMLAAIALAFYVQSHPGPIPRMLSVPMLCFFVLTIIGGSIVLPRIARKQAKTETPDERFVRRSRAAKGLKAGLLVWTLIFLNDVRMLAQHDVPWKFGILGMAIILFMIVACWVSLRRLKNAESRESGHSRLS